MLEFTSASQKTHESTSTQQIVPTLIHPPEQLEQEHEELSEVYEAEIFKNENKEGESQEWKKPEELQMASNSFLIEVKFIFFIFEVTVWNINQSNSSKWNNFSLKLNFPAEFSIPFFRIFE